jgi:hypothetical protein
MRMIDFKTKRKKPSSLIEPGKFYPGSLQHFFCHRVCIALLIYDLTNAGVYKHLRTYGTGEVRAIKRSPFDGNPVIGSLNNDVLFGMKTSTQFVSLTGSDPQFLAQTADIEAMRESGRRSIIAGCQNSFVSYQNGPYLATPARRAPCYQRGDIHKIFFPGRTAHTKGDQ